MIAVDLITEQELDKRFDTLSSKLKEVLTSERTLNIVDQICKKNNITDEEKVLIIHQIVGLVILGLVHPYDLGSEINDALSLENPKFSNAITEELNAKVFLPIKAELENNYHPVLTHSEQKIIPATPVENPSLPKSAPAPKTISLSDIGWSKQPAPSSITSINTPKPTPTIMPTPVAPKITTPAPTVPTLTPAPMMLHEDTAFKPAEKNVGFTLSKMGGIAEMGMSGGVPKAPTRPAVLEFGAVPTPKPTSPQPPKPPIFGAPSLASMSVVDSGPRNVSQIAPIAPTPMPMPKPTIPIPRPLQPPTPPQANKPIVKDFL
jgi:hypothetical protein